MKHEGTQCSSMKLTRIRTIWTWRKKLKIHAVIKCYDIEKSYKVRAIKFSALFMASNAHDR